MSEDATVDYIVVGFTRPEQVLAGFDRLAALVEAGPMRIADAEFIHSIMGNPSTIPARQVHPDLSGYDALDTRLLGQSDLDTVTDAIASGAMAAVILYSGAPIQLVSADWSRDGAVIAREGAVDMAALDAGQAGLR